MSTAENPALVLNADFRPLSYYPLSLCSWQDAIKAVFLERVSVIENYEHATQTGVNARLFVKENYSIENFEFGYKKLFDTVWA